MANKTARFTILTLVLIIFFITTPSGATVGNTWGPANLLPTETKSVKMGSISCPSANICFATELDGQQPLIVTITDGKVTNSTSGALPSDFNSGYSSSGITSPGAVICSSESYCIWLLNNTVQQMINGDWSKVKIAGAGQSVVFSTANCMSDFNCVIVGRNRYTGYSLPAPAVSVIESNGRWGSVQNYVGIPVPKNGQLAGADNISCLSSSRCFSIAAVQLFNSNSYQLSVVALSSGKMVYQSAVNQIVADGTYAGKPDFSIPYLKCFSSTSCVALGFVGVNGKTNQAQEWSLKGSVWTMTPIAGAKAVQSARCWNPSSCLAVDGSDNLWQKSNGRWSSAAFPSILDDDFVKSNQLTGIDCPKINVCTADGVLGSQSIYQGGTGAFSMSTPNASDLFAPSLTGSGATAQFGGAIRVKINASGNPAPQISVNTGELPRGMSFSNEGTGVGLLTGNPTQSGDFPLTVTASNSQGSVSETFDLVIEQKTTAVSVSNTGFRTGMFGQVNIVANGFPRPEIAVNSTSLNGPPNPLPEGLRFTDNMNGTASISGTPAQSGIFEVEIDARNCPSDQYFCSSAYKVVKIIVGSTPSFSSVTCGTFAVGRSSACSFRVSGYPAPTVALLSPLPKGLNLVHSGGATWLVVGVPTQRGLQAAHLVGSNPIGSAGLNFNISVH